MTRRSLLALIPISLLAQTKGTVLLPMANGKTEPLVYDLDVSMKDFSQARAVAVVLDNKVVYASSFMQEQPDTVVFKSSLRCTFVNCNLDNCVVPNNCVVRNQGGGSRRRFKVQVSDGADWEVDAQDRPVRKVGQ